MRRLTLSLATPKGSGSTIDPPISTFTSTQLYNAIMQYRLSKIYINGGYTQLHQSVGMAGTRSGKCHLVLHWVFQMVQLLLTREEEISALSNAVRSILLLVNDAGARVEGP